jgi:hypothetical protein
MALMGSVEILSSDVKAISVLQWRRYDFWRLGRVIAVATLNKNYELNNTFLLNKFPFICCSTLKFVDRGSIFFKHSVSPIFTSGVAPPAPASGKEKCRLKN